MPQMTMEQALQRALEDYQAGRLREAESLCRQVLAADANQAMALHLLGVLAYHARNYKSAASLIRQALALHPDWAEAHNNLGRALLEMGDLDGAVESYQQSLQRQPQSAEFHANLANALKETGQTQAAVEHLREALACQPLFPAAHSNLLFTLLYLDPSPESVFRELRKWDQLYGEPLCAMHWPHTNDRSPERRLRIGYVSADLRQHVCHFFTEGLFKHHDHERFEIFSYAEVKRRDVVTELFQKYSDHWLFTPGMSDEALAQRIRADQIDILVDPMGHSVDNRLLVFARKPAPIQVTYLSYPASTGMRAMDYRLTDALADPPGLSESWHTEELIRLPGSFLCYTPLDSCPEVSALPALQEGRVTLGCFNRMTKCSDTTLEMWAELLKRLPTARLIIKGVSAMSPRAWENLLARLARLGIGPDRLDLRERSPTVYEHLATYHQVDVALDTYPFNGAATTCEALWMGVPVVTRADRAHVTRVGASLLGNMGLGDLVASSSEEYVEKAVALANDLPRLAALRAGMRARMQASPLRDEPGFTRHIEAAYRTMWQKWCAQDAPRK